MKKRKTASPPLLIFCICLNRPPGIESLSRFCLLQEDCDTLQCSASTRNRGEIDQILMCSWLRPGWRGEQRATQGTADYCQPPYVSTSLYRHTLTHTPEAKQTRQGAIYGCAYSQKRVLTTSSRAELITFLLYVWPYWGRKSVTPGRRPAEDTRRGAEGILLRTNYQLGDELALWGALFGISLSFFFS